MKIVTCCSAWQSKLSFAVSSRRYNDRPHTFELSAQIPRHRTERHRTETVHSVASSVPNVGMRGLKTKSCTVEKRSAPGALCYTSPNAVAMQKFATLSHVMNSSLETPSPR